MSERLLRPLIIALGLTLLWQCVVWMTGAPKFILPGPLQVLTTLIDQLPLLLRHAGVTLTEILLGLLLGVFLGLVSHPGISSRRIADNFLIGISFSFLLKCFFQCSPWRC